MDGTTISKRRNSSTPSQKKLQNKGHMPQNNEGCSTVSNVTARKRRLTGGSKSEKDSSPARKAQKLSPGLSAKVNQDPKKNVHQMKSSMADLAKDHSDKANKDKAESVTLAKSAAKLVKEKTKESSPKTSAKGEKNPSSQNESTPAPEEGVKSSSSQPSGSYQKAQKVLCKSGIQYQVGFRLEALDKLGKWYPAKIISVDEEEGKVLIHFERWNSRYDEWISYPNNRLRPGARTSERVSFSKKKKYTVGDIVMARWTDRKMYPAKITATTCEGNLTVMFYDGIKKRVSETNVNVVPPEMEDKIKFPPKQSPAKQSPSKSERGKRKKLIVGGIFQAKRKIEFLEKPKKAKSSNSIATDEDVPSVDTPISSNCEDEIDDLIIKSEGTIEENFDTSTADVEQSVAPAFDELQAENAFGIEEKKVARKEFIIEEDHNHFKCPHPNCNKSFRKEKLLKAHIKHYHDIKSKDEVIAAEKSPIIAKAITQSPKTATPSPKATAKKVNKVVKEPIVKPIAEIKQEVKLPIPTTSTTTTTTPKETNKSIDIVEPKVEPEIAAPIPKPVASSSKKVTPVAPAKVPRKRNKSDSAIKIETSPEIVSQPEVVPEPIKVEPPPVAKPVETALTPQVIVPHIRTSKRRRLDTAESVASTVSLDSAMSAQSEDCCVVDVEKTEPGPKKIRSRSKKFLMSNSSVVRGEIINCSCGLNDENGFMVQCELCFSWQHGTCANIAKEEEVPVKYICSACLNPKLGRDSMLYHWDHDWFKKGEMPRFNYLEKSGIDQSSSMLSTHNLIASFFSIQNVTKSLRYKLKIAMNKYHPDLDQFKTSWTKDCKQVAEPTTNMEAILSGMTFDFANLQQTLASNANDPNDMYFDPSFFPTSKPQEVSPAPSYYPSNSCGNVSMPLINSQSIDMSLKEVSDDLSKIDSKNFQIPFKKDGPDYGENLSNFNSKPVSADQPIVASQSSAESSTNPTTSETVHFIKPNSGITPKTSSTHSSKSEPTSLDSLPSVSGSSLKPATEQSSAVNPLANKKEETLSDSVEKPKEKETCSSVDTLPPCKEEKTLLDETPSSESRPRYDTDQLSAPEAISSQSEQKEDLMDIDNFAVPTSANPAGEDKNILDQYIPDVIPTSLSNVSNALKASETMSQQSGSSIDQNVTASTEFGGNLPISMSDAELARAIGFSDATINSCQQPATLGGDDFMTSDAMIGTLTKEEEEMIKTLSKPLYPTTLVPREPDTEHYQKNVVNHVNEVLEELDHRLEVLETQIEILEIECESQHSSKATKIESPKAKQIIKKYLRDMEKLKSFINLQQG